MKSTYLYYNGDEVRRAASEHGLGSMLKDGSNLSDTRLHQVMHTGTRRGRTSSRIASDGGWHVWLAIGPCDAIFRRGRSFRFEGSWSS